MNRPAPKFTPTTRIRDTDLDLEPITLPSGQVLDEKAAAAYGEAAASRVAARRRGRPSLSAPGVESPQVSSRVSPDLRAAIDAIATRDGVRPAAVVRAALEEYVATHR
jgi:hypothetical protein